MRALGFAALVISVSACGGEFTGQASGGQSTGSAPNGGGASNGGASAGGTHGTGSQTGTGETSSTGGVSNGGTSGEGGAGGDGGAAAGGATGPGGTSSNGGTVSSGGGVSTGGIVGNGGTVVTGGTVSAGGVPNTGGISNTGGASSNCDASCTAGECSTCATSGFSCCNHMCINLANDRANCGKCGHSCADPGSGGPVCAGGTCISPPCPLICLLGVECCESTCCSSGTICCETFQSVVTLQCVTPDQTTGNCPKGNPAAVCASPDTPIATPDGPRAIASLRIGDHVLSVDHGRIVDVPLVDVGQREAHQHHVMRVELASGAVLEVSAPHPTADGRTFGMLRAGDTLSGERVVRATLVPYTADRTYDILPASDSGTYFAAGVLIGSTLGGSAAFGAVVPLPPLSVTRR